AKQTTYSKALRLAIEAREESLLANKVVICSLFLDPRLRRILLQQPENVMRAKTELKQLLRQLWQLKKKVNEASSTSSLSETNLLSQNSQSCSLLTELLSSIEVDAEEEADDDGQQELLKGYAEIDSYSPKPIS
ncbi:hypothetical protein KR026_004819, partial [Drosophila bipectinata]